VRRIFEVLRTFLERLWRVLQEFFDRLRGVIPTPPTPLLTVTDFSPVSGYPGTIVVITGTEFDPTPQSNTVTVGGEPALVYKGSATELSVITGRATATGPVEVTVGAATASGPRDFIVERHPSQGSGADGPPITFAGSGQGGPAAGAPTSGTLKVLVSLINPADEVPADGPGSRADVIALWDEVIDFYDQSSYSDLDVQVTTISAWTTITGNTADYLDAAINNVARDQISRVMAEAAQAAVDDGEDLDDYHALAAILYLDGGFIRAWGNWTQSTFEYADGGIDLSAVEPLSCVIAQEGANWGRFAHELGHAIVTSPFVTNTDETSSLGEDVYDSDLIDATVADAEQFDMMGAHDTHPLFSGYHLEQLDWYDASNIAELEWDRNPSDATFDIVAHGSAENTDPARFHLVKVKVTSGLSYYIQVRQRPDAGAVAPLVFDESIPLNGAMNDGGVVVTTVLTEQVNMNQQTRFITLLHDPQVLSAGQTAQDPARTIVITVENDNVQARPQVCRVRVQWAQVIADDPAGAFDLNIEPWDSSYQTPDIWVDRQPFGTFDNPDDAEGRPTRNGDKPRPLETNKFFARIHNDGAEDASDAIVTFYSVEPPGVGDNGNWAPLDTTVIPNIAAGGFSDVAANWVPLVDRHTCLKVFISQQLGEVTGGNNQAQENVFDFEAPAASVPDPVVMDVAVRNPIDREALVLLSIDGVPRGYSVHFPHRWLWMKPLQERLFKFTIVPTVDYGQFVELESVTAHVRLNGHLPRTYIDHKPSSHMSPIGGIMARVTPKRKSDVQLEPGEPRDDEIVAVLGFLTPAQGGQRVRVDFEDPKGAMRYAHGETKPDGTFRSAVGKRELEGGDLEAGQWKVVARVINAKSAAACESRPVYMNVNL
jgi:hypothetical protein